MGKLQEYAVLTEALDAAVERQIAETGGDRPAAGDALRADVLFPVRQKHQDLLTQLAVCAQGYLAMDVVRRNNDELIKGVDRAATTTVSALRIAVMLASALDNQSKVIEQVNALRGTTEDLIRGNARDARHAERRDPAHRGRTGRGRGDAADGVRADLPDARHDRHVQGRRPSRTCSHGRRAGTELNRANDLSGARPARRGAQSSPTSGTPGRPARRQRLAVGRR